MKKKRNKKGFTLLETLLSVALLVIISTMMMNGFMATINYSHNTSVQAKSASSNQSSAMSDLAGYASKAEINKTTAYSLLDTDGVQGSFSYTGDSVAGIPLILNKDNKLTVKVFKYLDNTTDLHDNLGLDQQKEDYNTKADNRFSLTYIPTVNKVGTNSFVGEIRIYKKNADGEYYWGYKGPDGKVHTISKVN